MIIVSASPYMELCNQSINASVKLTAATIVPVGILGQEDIDIGPYYHAQLPPNTNFEFDVSVFPTHYVAGTIELLNLKTSWDNVLGQRVSQINQIYFEVTPAP
jgi:hypothetical protein